MSAAVPQSSGPKKLGPADCPRHFARMTSTAAKVEAAIGRRIDPMHCAAAPDTWDMAQIASGRGDLR